ncbi:MAG: type II 3-dehydroquinate dehydratase [Lachnospiraceae bacterium]|nr:type II 3-dehydroquinate dehydratase [Lachnospiraceae bacterium]MBO4825204.1 type II 3-dehydroquinate dehydratase [Lachnospiraceae bacterium]MBR5760860.1 type II 3-dehydroquinate dehydratase [Lachnospiraceae bacterium]MBR5993533.1 type II 3-dehydroquinate dehydratase [Lachnospiraceae bacterium]
MKLLVVNGPNLNMLGKRDPAVYSSRTYEDLLQMIGDKASELNMTVEVFQSNHEGAIIDRLQDAMEDGTEGLVINPGAYTHYSYAIHDALEILSFPKIEVHISDINTREEFRRVSVTRPACDGQIVGEGFEGYLHAMEMIASGAVR